ncbi:MAG: guanylyltransferase [Methanobacteriaceae archaeon]|nr:guanylyltransferase [Methanobacteriaceae archaeon]
MKDYEIYSNLKVPKGSSIVLRLDGRSFHNLANKLDLKKPYDLNFSKLMVDVSTDLFNEFSPKFIYTFSDEINILLSEIPFSGRIEKLNSVFSSLATSSLINHLDNYFALEKYPLVSFDSRIIPMIKEDIPNYFKWRQDEAWRNCVNGYGIWALKKQYSNIEANEKIKGLKSKDIHNLLFNKGLNLNDVSTWKKRGIGLYKKNKKINGFNPKTNQTTISYRNYLYADYELEIFSQEFFKELFKED